VGPIIRDRHKHPAAPAAYRRLRQHRAPDRCSNEVLPNLHQVAPPVLQLRVPQLPVPVHLSHTKEAAVPLLPGPQPEALLRQAEAIARLPPPGAVHQAAILHQVEVHQAAQAAQAQAAVAQVHLPAATVQVEVAGDDVNQKHIRLFLYIKLPLFRQGTGEVYI
jgi:hypothetical protein